MKISLILATIYRTKEVSRFLRSLAEQTYRNFELIIVDQNPDDRLQAVLAPFTGQLTVQYLRSQPGLSRARNVGLKYVTGDLIAFPDDDCWYPKDLLEYVSVCVERYPECSGFTGRGVDGSGHPIHPHRIGSLSILTRKSAWKKAISYTIFLKRDVIASVGDFDELLGAGAGTPWGSGEETDYILRAIEADRRLIYEPKLCVYHPNPTLTYDAAALKRAKQYSPGMGRVLRKHGYSVFFLLYFVIRAIGGCIIAILRCNTGMMRFFLAVSLGLVDGWRAPI